MYGSYEIVLAVAPYISSLSALCLGLSLIIFEYKGMIAPTSLKACEDKLC